MVKDRFRIQVADREDEGIAYSIGLTGDSEYPVELKLYTDDDMPSGVLRLRREAVDALITGLEAAVAMANLRDDVPF
jgi:hypothetical protein